MKTIAIIPARGGSKSVPRKNIRNICGKPLIYYSIKTALDSKKIDRVIVSTDDEEIGDIAKEYGAEVPFIRPSNISDDYSLDIEFYQHTLQWLKDNEEYEPDLVVNLRPTNPIRSSETVDDAIDCLTANEEADSLRSVRLSELSPFKMWTISNDGFMNTVVHDTEFDEPFNTPRQLLPLCYWQDGYVDVTKYKTIMHMNSTTGDKIIPYIITEDSIDIDYEESIPEVEKILNGTTKITSTNRDKNTERHPS